MIYLELAVQMPRSRLPVRSCRETGVDLLRQDMEGLSGLQILTQLG